MDEEGSGNRLRMEDAFDEAITRIRFAPHSNSLLASSWDSTLRLYDGETSSLRLTAPLESPLLDCCFEDDLVALTVGVDSCIRRYDLGSGSTSILGKHDDLASCVEYSKETNQAISAGFDKQLMFWDARETNSSPICAQTVKAEIDSMSLSEVHLLVATGATVSMYDLRALRGPVQTSESATKYHVRCIRSAPNGRGYAVGTVGGSVTLSFSDDQSNKIQANNRYTFWCSPKSRNGRHRVVPVNDIVFHPKDNTFITADYEGYAIIWDGRSKRRLFEFPKFPLSIASISYNHEARLLAIASSYTYQGDHCLGLPQIFVYNMDKLLGGKHKAVR
ncbi:unnamed protein product [Victoria cruziana]